MGGNGLFATTLGFKVRRDFVGQLLTGCGWSSRVGNVAVSILEEPRLVFCKLYGLGKTRQFFIANPVVDRLPLLLSVFVPRDAELPSAVVAQEERAIFLAIGNLD